MYKRQYGFGIVEIILVVVLLLALGFIGWQVYSAQTGVNKTSNDTLQGSNSQVETDKNAGYIVIKDWGVRFKPAEGLNAGDITMYKRTDTANEAYRFTTKRVEAIGGYCDYDTDASKFTEMALIYRTKDEPTADELPNRTAKIGGYHYYARSSQAPCADGNGSNAVEMEDYQLIKNSLSSLEAAK